MYISVLHGSRSGKIPRENCGNDLNLLSCGNTKSSTDHCSNGAGLGGNSLYCRRMGLILCCTPSLVELPYHRVVASILIQRLYTVSQKNDTFDF